MSQLDFMDLENPLNEALYRAELEMVSRGMEEKEIEAYKHYMVDFLDFVDGKPNLTEEDIQNYIEGQLEDNDEEIVRNSLRLLFKEILRG